MVEIIPSINAETWDEVEKKIRLVESFVDWVHIDVANGTFAPNVLWHNSLDLVGFKTKCNIEIHLMEDRPEERIEAWLLEPVRRIIVHYEVTHDFPFIIAECRKDKIEIGLSVAPETSWTHLKPFVDDADLLQVLAVEPGRAGQHFDRHNISKIEHLRVVAPRARIEVDGGITPAVAKECIAAGADILVSAHYIFNHPSPKMAMRELQVSSQQ